MSQLNRIEDKLDALSERIHAVAVHHEGRISKVEAAQKGIISIMLAGITAMIGAVLHILHLR